jgi:hypothetical protein
MPRARAAAGRHRLNGFRIDRFHQLVIKAAGCCALFVAVALLSVTASSALLPWPQLRGAVVLVEQSAAHAVPASLAQTEFVLREAQSVRLLAQHERFILVRTADGLSGWVARADIGDVASPMR